MQPIHANVVRNAVEVFLAQLRIEYSRKFPDSDCPVPLLDQYDGFRQGVLMRSMKRAMETACPASR